MTDSNYSLPFGHKDIKLYTSYYNYKPISVSKIFKKHGKRGKGKWKGKYEAKIFVRQCLEDVRRDELQRVEREIAEKEKKKMTMM